MNFFLPPAANPELSMPITLVLMLITHGLVNAALLSAWNPIRCSFWNQPECTPDQAWMLNWLSLEHFHLFILLAALAKAAQGSVILEQRLSILSMMMVTSFLTQGIFMLDQLHPPMTLVQFLFYAALLLVMLYHNATSPPVVAMPAEALTSSSFDARKKLPIASLALAWQFLISASQLWPMTLGTTSPSLSSSSFSAGHPHLYYYTGGFDSHAATGNPPSLAIFHSMAKATVCDAMWITLILGGSVFWATVRQQKLLLWARIAGLGLSQILLTMAPGQHMAVARSRLISNFFSLAMALLGSY